VVAGSDATSSVDVSDLSGRVAFITGVARGQGRSHALALAKAGVDIIGIDICAQIPGVPYPLSTVDDLERTSKEIEALGRGAVLGVADVRDRTSMSTVLDRALADFGRLDFVIANAGVMPIHGDSARTMRAWQDCLDVLHTGVVTTTELTYPHNVQHGGGGSIVFTRSMAALQPMIRTEARHTLGLLGYAAAKAALENVCRNYASLLARERVRVNVVRPSGVNTPMIDNDHFREVHSGGPGEDDQVLVNAIPVHSIEGEDVSAFMV
jgi:NAD(P)-dependent dehydrogenase (short-subunit alcohol dehydrogenase family)